MKNNIAVLVLIVLIIIPGTLTAQWGVPSVAAPNSNVPPIISVGANSQTKVGGFAVLGTRTYDGTETDTDWLKHFSEFGTIWPRAGFASDSVFIVDKPPGSSFVDPTWQMDQAVFGFDTNAPVSVNGVWSDATIMSLQSISGNPLIAKNAIDTDVVERTLCSNGSDGSIIPCGSADVPTVSVSVNPSVIIANYPDRITVSWTSQGAQICYGVDGSGLDTGGATSGSDQSNTITLLSGESRQFTVLCTSDTGKVGVGSAVVTGS